MTTSDSIWADLGYLDPVGDEKREAYANDEQLPPIQYPGPPEFSVVRYMFRRLSLRR